MQFRRAALSALLLGALHCGGRSGLDGGLGPNGAGGGGAVPAGSDGGSRGNRTDGSDRDAANKPDDTVQLGDKRVPNEPQVAAGAGHVCLRTKKSELFCWGSNGEGQLGDGTLTSRAAAKKVDLPPIVRVGAGNHHTCALASDQSVYCWGDNSNGQLGQGTRTERVTVPQRVQGAGAPIGLAINGRHSCAYDAAGKVTCWGRNASGECGANNTTYVTSAAQIPNFAGVVVVAAGNDHNCAVMTDGTVRCWGGNYDGQLGNGSAGGRAIEPAEVLDVTDARGIAAGDDHTCVILRSGAMRCWGDGFLGELGDGRGQSSDIATSVVGVTDARQATAGLEHTCVVMNDGHVACWGKGMQGQLGNRSTDLLSMSPVAVSGIADVASVAAGEAFSCVAFREQGASCWGGYGLGELSPSGELILEPLRVLGL